MSRPAGEPLTRITINLLTEDYETLTAEYPAGYQLKIRELVHAFCDQLRNNEADQTLLTLARMYPPHGDNT